jgi:energy-coupling factor transporter ATP-binding protein EcfA2
MTAPPLWILADPPWHTDAVGGGHIINAEGVWMTYEGVDIRALSPGTRGIVALLLYLALDGEDGRPRLIDQPEENLDLRSIQEVLVPLFQAAKGSRQVIMVTHNANLVINADADQVIVATCGTRQSEGLPPIQFEGGSLDSRNRQEKVCEILEGGRTAFLREQNACACR